MPESYETIYQIVKLIPWGRVTTYGAIANCIGNKAGARLVGWALHASLCREDIPAHRVVNRIGLLTGRNHFATPTLMQEKLEAEGIIVKHNRVVNFEKLFWNPYRECFGT